MRMPTDVLAGSSPGGVRGELGDPGSETWFAHLSSLFAALLSSDTWRQRPSSEEASPASVGIHCHQRPSHQYHPS